MVQKRSKHIFCMPVVVLFCGVVEHFRILCVGFLHLRVVMKSQILQLVVKFNSKRSPGSSSAFCRSSSELSQSLLADCGELFACSSVYLRHVLSNYYQLLREITKDLPSTHESPQSRLIFQDDMLDTGSGCCILWK